MPNKGYSASILGSNFLRLEEEIKRIQVITPTPWLHFDVMDGHFVPNLSFGLPILTQVRKAFPNIVIDTHLMISNPEEMALEYVKKGSDYVTVHVEVLNPSSTLLRDLKKANEKVKVGLSIKPSTDLSLLKPFFSQLDLILIMSVEPGFGGQAYLENSNIRLKELLKIKQDFNYNYKISLDGGINLERAKDLFSHGADVLVMGTALFKAENLEAFSF